MIKRLLLVLTFFIMFLHPISINAENYKYVEIFDPKLNRVVRIVQLNQELQNMVGNWIINIEDMYGKLDPVTDDGYAIRVPLDPPVKVHSKVLNAIVSEVYIIIPEKEMPFYMIFENENKLSCFMFNGSIDMLSKALNFKLK
jgi:hypothetical protein